MSTTMPDRNTDAPGAPPVRTPRIAMREIDLERLEDVEENREAIRFYVPLSETPPEAWIQEFDIAYRQTPYSLKPPVEVSGDRLEIVFLPRYSGELQGFFQFLGLIVRRANDEYHRSEEMHTSNAQEQRRAQFREALKRVTLPR